MPRPRKAPNPLPQSYSCNHCNASFSTARRLSCHRNASRDCKKAYLNLLATLNGSDDSDVDDMDDADSSASSNADMDYGPTFDEPEPVDLPSYMPSTTPEPLPPSAAAPVGQDTEANEDEEEVHQEPSTPTSIDIVESYYPGAGSIVDTGTPRFKRLYKEQQRSAPDNIHHPFASEEELEYGTWMNNSGLALTEMDKLLNLGYVRWFSMKHYEL
jgi:hypothetical protein